MKQQIGRSKKKKKISKDDAQKIKKENHELFYNYRYESESFSVSDGDFPEESDKQPVDSEEEEEQNIQDKQFSLKHFRMYGIPTDELELCKIVDEKKAEKIRQLRKL